MLTDIAVRNAQPRAKPARSPMSTKCSSRPKGGRCWRLRYYCGGREKLTSLGTYPEVTRKEGRERRDEVRWMLPQGLNLSAEREATGASHAGTFETIAPGAEAACGELSARSAARFRFATLNRDAVESER